MASIRADEHRCRLMGRWLGVARAVAEKPRTLTEVAAAVDSSERTVRRIVYALQRVGIDVEVLPADKPGGAARYTLNRRSWLAVLDLPRD